MKVMLDTDSCIYLINRRKGMTPQAALHDCGISAVVLGDWVCRLLPTTRASSRAFQD